jgi:hypothetical protein
MADQSSTPSAREFGAAFKSFLEQSVGETPATESAFAARIRAHLDADPATLPIVSDIHEVTDQPNLQLAMDDWLGGPGRSSEALGVSSEDKRIGGLGLGDLLAPAGGLLRAGPAVGPVEWVTVRLDGDRTVTCLQFGLLLVLRVDGLDRLVARTEGVSPAFIRELLRKAALLAVGPGEEIVVEDRHLDQALHELVVGGGELTRRLLGAAE